MLTLVGPAADGFCGFTVGGIDGFTVGRIDEEAGLKDSLSVRVLSSSLIGEFLGPGGSVGWIQSLKNWCSSGSGFNPS